MSCEHGNHPDACDYCDALEAAYKSGQRHPPAASVDVEELRKWIDDGDTIPAELIETCRGAICMEFGNNGTDGYYKRILVKVFRALIDSAGGAKGGRHE